MCCAVVACTWEVCRSARLMLRQLKQLTKTASSTANRYVGRCSMTPAIRLQLNIATHSDIMDQVPSERAAEVTTDCAGLENDQRGQVYRELKPSSRESWPDVQHVKRINLINACSMLGAEYMQHPNVVYGRYRNAHICSARPAVRVAASERFC
jgi:hypothetical protein